MMALALFMHMENTLEKILRKMIFEYLNENTITEEELENI